MPHLTRPALAARYPVHVTLRVRRHVYQLRSRRCFRVVGAALLAGRERHGVRLCHYSVQGNHVHLLVEAKDAVCLGRAMKGLGVRIARGLNRVMGTRGPALADRYHARILRSPRQVRNALAYVLRNHQHHARGWRAPPAGLDPSPRGALTTSGIDPYTSGGTFDGWRRGGGDEPSAPGTRRRGRSDGGPSGPPRAGPPAVPVATAHTWLLARGWRKHGLIELT